MFSGDKHTSLFIQLGWKKFYNVDTWSERYETFYFDTDAPGN
jgi:hypothetical protein